MSKILVVEDEIDVSKVLRKRLQEANYEVVVAGDAYQAIEYVHKENIDLIILDLMLPAGGGLSVLKNVKLSPKLAYLPILVLTGIRDDQYKAKVLEAGVDEYMEKPYDNEVLIKTINDLLLKQGKR